MYLGLVSFYQHGSEQQSLKAISSPEEQKGEVIYHSEGLYVKSPKDQGIRKTEPLTSC